MRGVGTFLGAILIAAGIFWFLAERDTDGRQRPLARTLSTIGEQFLSVVQDSKAKSTLQKAFEQFLTRAEAEELPPEQIESVAVVLLNAATVDTVVAPEKMAELMELPPAAPAGPSARKLEEAERGLLARERAEALRQVNWRLTKLVAFHERMERLRRRHPQLADQIRRAVAYRIDRNLKVSMDRSLFRHLADSQRREIEDACRDLERQNLLIWAGESEEVPGERAEGTVGLGSVTVDVEMTPEEEVGKVPAAVTGESRQRAMRLRILREEIWAGQDSLRRAAGHRAGRHPPRRP